MTIDWKVAFPLYPEYRILSMVWYVPLLSPMQNAIEKSVINNRGPTLNIEEVVYFNSLFGEYAHNRR